MPDIIRLDNTITALNRSMLVNRSTGMGTMRDSFNETEVGYVPILGEQELRSLHRGNWWIRRIIDVPAMDMVKAGVTLTHPSNDAEAIQKVLGLYEAGGEQSPYSRKMGGAMAFQRAEMYARWFGRGYIVMRVNGNEKLEKPLTKVKSFEGFSVLDRYQLRPSNDAINYEDPEFYQIARRYQRGSELKGAEFHQKIHETRVLVFDGAFIHPYDINLESADGAHDSVVQSLYECFCRHYAVQNSIAKGLDSYSLFKVAIANLGELMMQDEGEAALTKTLNAIAEMISMHRILVQDGETSNSEFQERSFTGVAENAKGFKDELTAASGLPHYKLWGSVDKSGLADSGGAESRAWADTVNSLQISQFKDNHRRVFNALFEATGGVIPDGYGIDYPSIYKATPKEEAELKKTEADTYSTLITAEVLNPLEVKLALATGEEIGNVLDAEAIEVELEKTKSFESIGKGENGRADFKYSHINFKPPLSVQKAFQRALSATESGKLKIGSGMESATKAWAKKLASGQPVSPEKARQGYRWFKRNARFESSPKDSPAWASWAYWGYSEGRSWFNRLWQQMESAGRANESRNDDATPTKRILKWNDFEIGLQYLPFEKRHGRVLPAGYGHFRKTRGADGMAVDVYVGTQLTSSKVFVVDQLIDGEFDEEKMVIGVERMEDAISIYTSAMPREMMGGVREISLEDLAKYRTNVEVKADAEQFVPASSGSVTTTLPALAESDFDWASVRDIADEQGWEWDDEPGRYRGADGELVTYQQILEVTQTELSRLEDELDEAATLLIDGDASVSDWEELVAEITVSAALLFFLFGFGGSLPGDEEEALIRQELTRQFEFLLKFSQSIADGAMTESGIRARTKLYVNDAQLMYGQAQELLHPVDLFPYYRNVPGPCQSCDECPQITARGISPRGTLKPIGQRQCFVNCCCQWAFHKTQDERFDEPTLLDRGHGWLKQS